MGINLSAGTGWTDVAHRSVTSLVGPPGPAYVGRRRPALPRFQGIVGRQNSRGHAYAARVPQWAGLKEYPQVVVQKNLAEIEAALEGSSGIAWLQYRALHNCEHAMLIDPIDANDEQWSTDT